MSPEAGVTRPAPTAAPRVPPQLLLDVSELIKHDARSGIQRVVRSVLEALALTPPAGYSVRPVYDAGGHYAYAGAGADAPLSRDGEPIAVRPGDLFFGLDLSPDHVANNAAVLQDLRRHGVRLYFMIYDLVPVRHPELFAAGMGPWFGHWLHTVASLADGLLCISRAVADELLDWLAANVPRRAGALAVGYCHLGADLQASRPSHGEDAGAGAALAALAQRPTLLMVGTLEPRKMHAQALHACDLLWQAGSAVNLVIVGKPGWNVDLLAARLRRHPQAGQQLFWLEQTSDDSLLQLYRGASGLLAASLDEGFGLPLIEAAQHGLPVIARDIPVFREVAGEHAYYFSAANGSELAAALADWLALHASGQAPASAGMPRLSWAESAGQMLDCLLGQRWYGHASTALP
ncbi:glycosyltransferase family 4 protein [Oxalobacteraceae bacterium]|nr:glycosyltransferase family 4 protein [Oxalobacteraceae bacterium]